MKRVPLHAALPFFAVKVVTDERQTYMGEMDTNLMSTSCYRTRFNSRKGPVLAKKRIICSGIITLAFSAALTQYDAVAFAADRGCNTSLSVLQNTIEYGNISL